MCCADCIVLDALFVVACLFGLCVVIYFVRAFGVLCVLFGNACVVWVVLFCVVCV